MYLQHQARLTTCDRCSAAGCVLPTVILVVKVVLAIRSVRFQLLLGSFQMNIIVLVPLQESIAQHSAGKHDQWQGYMTVFVVNHGIMISLSILSTVIRPMLKFDVSKPHDCFRQKGKWTLAIH